MTAPSSDNQEETAGGLAGKIAGKVKEVAGAATGDGDLAREGRLQQAQADTEAEARRDAAEAKQQEAEAELEADKAENAAERARLQTEVAADEREAVDRSH